MKKCLLLLALMPLMLLRTNAESVIVDGVKWYYETYWDYNRSPYERCARIIPGDEKYAGDLAIPSSLGGCPVTQIKNEVFSGCSELKKVTIPSGVSSIGDSVFENCCKLKYVEIPSSVRSIGGFAFSGCGELVSVAIPVGVTSIENNTFDGCVRLTSVTIPDGVKRIENSVFRNCSGLKSITIPVSVTSIGWWAFYGCSNLISLTIPQNVTNIGDSAFTGCNALTSISVDGLNSAYSSLGGILYNKTRTLLIVSPGGVSGVVEIPKGVTSVKAGAFAGCSRLTSVEIPSSVVSIGDSTFSGCGALTSINVDQGNAVYSSVDGILYNKAQTSLIVCPGAISGAVRIPEGVTSINTGTFSGCHRLVSVTIPSSVMSIGDSAFSGCSGLTSVTIPSGVTRIGDYAFYGCCGLADALGFVVVKGVLYDYNGTASSVTIPSNVTAIGGCAFDDCSKLASIMIPGNVMSIGEWAFLGCDGLTSVTISKGVTVVKKGAFQNCEKLTSVMIPSSVTSIGERAFSGCSSLASLIISEGVENIEMYAFSDCISLMSVTIPSSVVNIGYGAFYDCRSLVSVVVSEGVAHIGDHMFWGCNSLASVIIPESVTSIGAWAFASSDTLTLLSIPRRYTLADIFTATYTKITSVAIADGVTHIGASMFSGCNSLTSVTIPESVISIGSDAFSGCYSLTSIAIPSSVKIIGSRAFWDCDKVQGVYIRNLAAWCEIEFCGDKSNPLEYAQRLYLNGQELTDLIIPDEVTYISDWAFCRCKNLTSVTMPESVTRIGDCAFEFSGIKSIAMSSSLTNVGDYAFAYCCSLESVVIPESVSSIGTHSFYECYGLKSVTLPEGIITIGNSAFSRCAKLSSVTIPSSLTSISGVFSGCSALTSVTIPEGVTDIGGAFSDCSGLTSVVIPSSVKSIGYKAFSGCSGLMLLDIPSSVRSIGISAFSGCGGLISVRIPSSVTSIEYGAFSGCSSLTSVDIPSSVTSVGNSAFSGCSGLISVVIPSRVANIGKGVFSGCTGLLSVTIPEGVTNIESSAFYNCSRLSSLTIPSSVMSIGIGAFSGCGGLTSITLPFIGSRRGNSGSPESLFGYIFGTSSYVGATETTQFYAGASWFCSKYFIPSSLTSVVITDETKIGYGAFYGCGSLMSVSIPSSVTSIARLAFYKTKLLSSHPNGAVIVDNCLIGYKGTCSGSVVIPDGVRMFADEAFYDCSEMTSISIPEGVMSIGSNTFCNCSGLRTVSIPKSVTNIANGVFFGCSGLTSITLPFVGSQRGDSGTEALFGYVFGTSSYTGATAYKQYYEMSSYLTYYIPSSLRSVVITDETKISYGAFSGCSGLTSIIIPSSVISIESCAFSRCSGLTKITLPFVGSRRGSLGSEEAMFGYIFGKLSYNNGVATTQYYFWSPYGAGYPYGSEDSVTYYLPYNLRTVVITDETRIDYGAFSNCGQLVSVTIPSSVTSIGKNAFLGCELETVYVGKGCVERMKGLYAWPDGVNFFELPTPSVAGDSGAMVTGDTANGFVIKPSKGNTIVEVTIPQGVDAAKVTIEVTPKVERVKPNGAKVKVVVGDNDITDYLVIPESEGVMNIAAATVKEEIVRETLDPSKDAVIELDAANPQLITAPTRKGLTYTLYEGHRLESLSKGDSKLGDGDPWEPTITVSGGDAAFYSIDVSK